MLLLLSSALVLSVSHTHAHARACACARDGNVIADVVADTTPKSDTAQPALSIALATKVSDAQRALVDASRANTGVSLPAITDIAQFDRYGDMLSTTPVFVDALTKAGTTPNEFAAGFAIINKALLVATLTDASAQRGLTFNLPESLRHVPMADVQFVREHRDELTKLGFQQQVSAQVQTPVKTPAPAVPPASGTPSLP